MSLVIYAGWDFAELGGTATVTDSGGAFSVSFTSGKYSHLDNTSVLGSGQYSGFATALQTELNAESGVGGYTVTYFNANEPPIYGISGPSHSWGFTGDTGTHLRRILGLSAALSADTDQESDVVPYYLIETTGGCLSRDSRAYEPRGVVSGGHTLGGRSFGVAASDPIQFRDFEVMFEPLAKVFADEAPDGTTAGDAPWTYEHLVQHCRMTHPLRLWDPSDGSGTLHWFRADGASFDDQYRTRETPDYDDQWHIRFRTFTEGAIAP